jgi:hypothetical protein
VIIPIPVLGLRLLVYKPVEVGTLYGPLEVLKEVVRCVPTRRPLRRRAIVSGVVGGVVIAGFDRKVGLRVADPPRLRDAQVVEAPGIWVAHARIGIRVGVINIRAQIRPLAGIRCADSRT